MLFWFSMTRDVVDLAIGVDITLVEWDEKGGLVEHFKVYGSYGSSSKSKG